VGYESIEVVVVLLLVLWLDVVVVVGLALPEVSAERFPVLMQYW
jgi:hypothetical protein